MPNTSHPYALTAQLSPLNFNAKYSHLQASTSAFSTFMPNTLTLMLSLLSSHLSTLMPTLTSTHDLSSQFSCKYSDLQAWSHLSTFMPILSPLYPHCSALTCQFSCQYSHPYTLTAQPLPVNFHAKCSDLQAWSQLSIFMQILWPPSMISALNFHANTLTSKHDLTSPLSCQYSHPYTLTAQPLPVNFHAKCSDLQAWSQLSIFMQILWPPSMISPLHFHANTLTLIPSLLSPYLSIFMPILSPLYPHCSALTCQFSCQMLWPLYPHCSALTCQFSCQYSHPYTLTAQPLPVNFHAKCSDLQAWSQLSIFMRNTLTSKHDLTSPLSCQYSHPYTLTAQPLPVNFHAKCSDLQAWSQLSIFMQILWPPSMISALNFHASKSTSKHDLTSPLSCQYSHPYTLTAQPLPVNFHAKCSDLQAWSQLSIFMQILWPPSMISPLNFHANTLTSTHGLTSQFSCQYSHLQAWS